MPSRTTSSDPPPPRRGARRPNARGAPRRGRPHPHGSVGGELLDPIRSTASMSTPRSRASARSRPRRRSPRTPPRAQPGARRPPGPPRPRGASTRAAGRVGHLAQRWAEDRGARRNGSGQLGGDRRRQVPRTWSRRPRSAPDVADVRARATSSRVRRARPRRPRPSGDAMRRDPSRSVRAIAGHGADECRVSLGGGAPASSGRRSTC